MKKIIIKLAIIVIALFSLVGVGTVSFYAGQEFRDTTTVLASVFGKYTDTTTHLGGNQVSYIVKYIGEDDWYGDYSTKQIPKDLWDRMLVDSDGFFLEDQSISIPKNPEKAENIMGLALLVWGGMLVFLAWFLFKNIKFLD